jgi:hypothetical protein
VSIVPADTNVSTVPADTKLPYSSAGPTDKKEPLNSDKIVNHMINVFIALGYDAKIVKDAAAKGEFNNRTIDESIDFLDIKNPL